MGSGASSADLTQADVDADQDDPSYSEEERRRVERDMRDGVVFRFTGEVGEMRVPADGRYLIVCRGACGADTCGMGNLSKPARETTEEGWDKHHGGAAAQVEAQFRLTRKHVFRVLVGGFGEKAYCGGGASYVGTRIAEEVGWEMQAPRPKFFWVPVPGDDVRPHGKPFITWAESLWGSRVARMQVAIPKYIVPRSVYRVKIPNNVRFLRNWETLLVAGGGGGAGQNSKGHSAVLDEEGTHGSGASACSGGKDGGAGDSRLEGNYPAHGGAGLSGSGKSHETHFGAQSLVLGGQGSSGGGGFGGGGAGSFAGGGGGGYSGGGAGGLSNGSLPFGGGGGGSFIAESAMDTIGSVGHREGAVVFIKLLEDWRDPLCPPKDRLRLMREDPTLDEAHRNRLEPHHKIHIPDVGDAMCSADISVRRVENSIDVFVRRIESYHLDSSRFVALFRKKKPLPGKFVFSIERGWQQILDEDEEFLAQLEDVNAPAKEMVKDWEGTDPSARFLGFQFIESSIGKSLDKMEECGFEVREDPGLVRSPSIGSPTHSEAGGEGDPAGLSLAFQRHLGNTRAQSPWFTALTGGNSRGQTPIEGARRDVVKQVEFMSESSQEFPGSELALIKAASLGEVESLKEFIRQGLPINKQRAGMGSALHSATRNRRTESIEVLLRAGADVELRDEHGYMPIQYAVLQGDVETYRQLVDYHPHLWAVTTNEGDTLLHLATREPPSKDLIEELLSKGVEILATNQLGKTCYSQLREQQNAAMKDGLVGLAKMLAALENTIHEALAERKHSMHMDRVSLLTRKPYIPALGPQPAALEPDDDFRLLTEWLESTGIPHVPEYAKLFLAAEWGLDDLHKLTEESLVEMGISKIGIRNKIMHVVKRNFHVVLDPNFALLQNAGLL